MTSFTQSLSLTAGTSSGSIPNPSGAAATALSNAGYKKVVFVDDFTSSSTIAPSAAPTAGYNWYWDTNSGATTTSANYSLSSSQLASAVSNGNSGGGAQASTQGGILTLTGITGNTGNLGILNTAPTNGTTTLQWRRCYFEAYCQFKIQTDNNNNGWPGFWSWSNVNPTTLVEIDFMEFEDIYAPAYTYGTVHQWPGNVSSGATSTIADSNWHTYGCLWTGSGTTETISWYYDQVFIGSVTGGAGTSWPTLQTQYSYIALSAGNPQIMNIDWVRVWQ